MAHIALDETIEMSKAVQKAIDLTNEDETLIVVSSDHSHAMTISGYPTRGNPILGASNVWQGLDDIDYLTLSYANGPGYRQYNNSVRPDVTKEEGFIKSKLKLY